MFGHQQSTLLDRPLASMKRTNPVFGREDANDRVRWWTAAGPAVDRRVCFKSFGAKPDRLQSSSACERGTQD